MCKFELMLDLQYQCYITEVVWLLRNIRFCVGYSGECKYTIQDADAHSEWVSCVRFSPNNLQPTIVSASWDKTVKIWNLSNCKLRSTLAGHGGYVNTVAVSPDGSLCASGGKDGKILLWDLSEGKQLYSLEAGAIIHSLCFSPNRYWLCAATENAIRVWDLESKSVVDELKVDFKNDAENVEGAATSSKKKVFSSHLFVIDSIHVSFRTLMFF